MQGGVGGTTDRPSSRPHLTQRPPGWHRQGPLTHTVVSLRLQQPDVSLDPGPLAGEQIQAGKLVQILGEGSRCYGPAVNLTAPLQIGIPQPRGQHLLPLFHEPAEHPVIFREIGQLLAGLEPLAVIPGCGDVG